ncbi:MAG: bifunctional 5,10-methylenetetrahydrofolate dehydrogenase/5,10-methenyltetrahydrofolate cyclohydrolase [Firmicutes bacterium]|nr:bifunctional 5,10-methylenetetrahydrofolate dehydrogenase/5,10-methenyltetrahydrofolate cyclohydrolase [Bacillota bacterium]
MIIDGKKIAGDIKVGLAKKAKDFERKNGRKCGLAIIIVGDDEASKIYVSKKEQSCVEVGVRSVVHRLPRDTKEPEVLSLIEKLNNDKTIDGILVQLPLPPHIDEIKTIEAISPDKDVDGFTAVNAGKLSIGYPCMVPCTAIGVIELIKSTGALVKGSQQQLRAPSGKSDTNLLKNSAKDSKVAVREPFTSAPHAVVVGRSNIVGKPVAKLLLNHDCTVTIAHSKTKDLGAVTRLADILVVAVGRKNLVTKDMVKPGAVVIDVGINRDGGQIFGDVDFDEVKKVAGYITPVPGGVGPMTVACLLKNVLSV